VVAISPTAVDPLLGNSIISPIETDRSRFGRLGIAARVFLGANRIGENSEFFKKISDLELPTSGTTVHRGVGPSVLEARRRGR
jgi:hypothetical protein